ncbi:MAG: hypothetical protein A4E65_01585 [Syntrophorhabdus sp. PtaU1.Bin153]|nr:MAG: hypothetical protein A4E65_01585 [Syntrophorhabdus sp. PtaU1.Bin153]
MNSSVTATEILKLPKSPSRDLRVTKSKISGWSTRSIPMLAPRLVPPCFITSVLVSKIFMKEHGPLARPFVVPTLSPAGRSREKLNPVPPPILWTRAACFAASKMPSIESSTGSTKHADMVNSGRPALVRAGVFGRKRQSCITLKNSSLCSSGAATASDTRLQRPGQSSMTFPNESFRK